MHAGATVTLPEHNVLGLDYRSPWARPAIRGRMIDLHVHLFSARHARPWFESADHYGIDLFSTQTPLEEAMTLQREYGKRLLFVAVPAWQKMNASDAAIDEWVSRLDAFRNLGAYMAKVHAAPGTMKRTGLRLNDRFVGRILHEIASRGMIIMTHIGDPDTWYEAKYANEGEIGDRELHYHWFEQRLEEFRGHPWMCAHLGGNPENLPRLQRLLDRFPDLMLDLSATRWIVRELSKQRDAARAFIIRNQDRLIWGSDQVSGDTRDFDFLASRFWAHRTLFETDYVGLTNIFDPDLSKESQPMLRGLALPGEVLQKLYHDNAVRLCRRVGVEIG